MQFGLDVPTTGDYANVHSLTQLAVDAETAGWDGFFIWDVLSGVDPWIALTAIALHTSRIKIGLLVAPLPRHRPWLVAKRLAELDQLSQGRVICTVGIGHLDNDFAPYGEICDEIVRGRQLDEGLEVMAGLWSNERFSFAGEHYKLTEASLQVRPLQDPRIPIWVAGGWPRRAPFRRAVHWDGVSLKSVNVDKGRWLALEEFQACVAYVRSQRQDSSFFDIVMTGETPLDRQQGSAMVRPFEAAGATWWVEEGLGFEFSEFRERVLSGPPRA